MTKVGPNPVAVTLREGQQMERDTTGRWDSDKPRAPRMARGHQTL